jgi:hypothetical protein
MLRYTTSIWEASSSVLPLGLKAITLYADGASQPLVLQDRVLVLRPGPLVLTGGVPTLPRAVTHHLQEGRVTK